MSTVHKYKHVGRCKATFAINYNFSLMYVAKNRIVAQYKNVWYKHSNHEGKNFLFLQLSKFYIFGEQIHYRKNKG